MDYNTFLVDVFADVHKQIMRAFPPQESSQKAKRELVTSTDTQVEDYIRSRIKQTYPEHGIIGEEFADHNPTSKYQWVIDPIDGTTNFVHHIPLFCSAVALKKDNEVIAAGVHLPITNTTYFAGSSGAYKNNTQIHATQQELSAGVVGFCHANDDDGIHTIHALYESYKKRTRDFRRLGSANLEICMVASGELAGFLGYRIKPWDFLAGCFIARQAGCSVSGWSGEDWQHSDTESVIVSAPGITLQENA